MIAVIKGDIIASRKLVDQEKWLLPLQELLNKWGTTPENWEIVWGDSFQIEIDNAEEVLYRALQIKSLIKQISPKDTGKLSSTIDVRMAIGIGEKTYSGKRISESNGPAFINAGVKFSLLKKEKVNLALQTPWQELDDEINLYLRLAGIFMDKWSISSAQLLQIVLNNPKITQIEIGEKLSIKQSAVSGRWNRAYVDEVLAIDNRFRKKIKQLLA